MSLRIVQFGPTLYKGGVSVTIRDLSVGLARAGNEVLLIGNGAVWAPEVEQAGVHCLMLPWRGTRSLLLKSALIGYHIRNFQADVVHVHGRGQSLACIIAGCRPDVFTMHSSVITDRAGFFDYGIIRKHLSPTARRILTLDKNNLAYLSKQLAIPPSAIDVIPNGVDCGYFLPPTAEQRTAARNAMGIPKEATLALFVGRMHEVKNPDLVVDLAHAARQAGLPNTYFALVGDGPLLPAVQQRIEQLDLSDRCRMYGWTNPREAYWAADLLVMPSAYEGFGIVGAEALACGCPVLRTKTGGSDAMIVDSVTGWAIGPNPADFIAKGVMALSDPESLRSMRSNARLRAVEELSIERQVQLTLSAYSRL